MPRASESGGLRPEAAEVGPGAGAPGDEAGAAQTAGASGPKADLAAAPFPWASRGAHCLRPAGVALSVSRFSETTATLNSLPEKIYIPVFKLIPKRRVFF